VRLQHAGTGLRAGSTARYAIWVWSSVGARQVTVSARLAAPSSVGPARYTVCPSARKTVCTINTLPKAQAFGLVLSVPVGRTAAGSSVTLSVVAAAPTASPAQATISAPLAGPSTQPQGHQSLSPSAAPTLPPVGNPTLPPVPVATITPGNIPGLFPTVTPSPSAGLRDPPRRPHHRVHVTLTSATLPINLRLIGGQLAGLAVLAAAVTMVIARLSLRTQRSSPASGSAADGRSAPSAPSAPSGPDAPAKP
jgi:hypothetical protein